MAVSSLLSFCWDFALRFCIWMLFASSWINKRQQRGDLGPTASAVGGLSPITSARMGLVGTFLNPPQNSSSFHLPRLGVPEPGTGAPLGLGNTFSISNGAKILMFICFT